jgi:hypothetical protein
LKPLLLVQRSFDPKARRVASGVGSKVDDCFDVEFVNPRFVQLHFVQGVFFSQAGELIRIYVVINLAFVDISIYEAVFTVSPPTRSSEKSSSRGNLSQFAIS